jgi:hypothetical protein
MFEPGQPEYITEIDNTLEALQKAVGGYIETVGLENGLVLICNEEGKLRGLTPNRYIRPLRDTICGTFLICGTDGEDFCSLTEEQAGMMNIL